MDARTLPLHSNWFVVLTNNRTICYSLNRFPIIAAMSDIMITNEIKLTEVYTTSYMCTCICTVDSTNTIVIAREEYFKFYDKLIPLNDKQYGPFAVHVTYYWYAVYLKVMGSQKYCMLKSCTTNE